MAKTNATAKWNGTLKEGNGKMNIFNQELPFTYKSRFEDGEETNPEELVGAAHAGCYSMFLSALISGEELTPEIINTSASVTLDSDDIGPKITNITLECEVLCEGLSNEKFEELTEVAKEKCPISRLYGGTDITLNAKLLTNG